MFPTTNSFSSTLTEIPPNKFIRLKGKIFAEYKIVYHINDAYSINHLSKFNSKHQLLFQKFKNKIQQLNLMLVDSIFPNILADVVLDVFLNDISSFNQYTNCKKTIVVIDPTTDKDYFKYKFYSFFNLLLFAEIASNKVCKRTILKNRIYCLKNNITKEIKFYSVLQQNELQFLLLDKMKLEINLSSSSISKKEVILHLKIFVE
ncbi:hypothetical protein BH11BAC1_BH11BAC1_00590 [soil metagenome]